MQVVGDSSGFLKPTARRGGAWGTYLLMGREDGKPGTSRLVLLGRAKSPEGNGTSPKLREPALQLGLGRVVRETGHVEDLTPLRQEGPNIGTSIHGPGQHVRVLLAGLRLADKSS